MSEKKQVVNNLNSIRELALGSLSIFAIFLTIVLPLKFGIITGIPEAPTGIPQKIYFFDDIIIMFWPSMLFPILASILLLGVLIFSPPLEEDTKTSLLIPLSWILLFFSVFPGFLNASTLDFPIIQTATFAGYAAFTIAIYRLIDIRPEIKIWLINAIVISSLITVFIGIHQYFVGFKATLEYVKKQEMETGIKLSYDMMLRVVQKRVFSTFSICNSLAAHIVLTIPILTWGVLKSKIILKSAITVSVISLLFILSPPTTVNLVFLPIAFILVSVMVLSFFKFSKNSFRLISLAAFFLLSGTMIWVLYLTHSRGAIIGLGAAIIFFILIIPIKTRYKFLTVGAISGITGLLMIFDIEGRDFSSLTVRLDYCLRSFEMFLRHPFAGTGWGDFFHEYTKFKNYPGNEAPHNPHNFIMSFTGQAGITGFAASIIVTLLPFLIFFKKMKDLKIKSESESQINIKGINDIKWLNILIITGWCAWCIHSLADFNIQVPGSVATAIIMILILNSSVDKERKEEAEVISGRQRKLNLVFWYGCCPLIALICLIVAIHQLKFETSLTRFREICKKHFSVEDRSKVLSDDKLEYLLNRCVKSADYSPIPWMDAGNYAEAHMKWDLVEFYYTEAIKRSPERAGLYYHLSIGQLNLGKKREALKNLKKAAELFPNKYKKEYEKARAMMMNPY